MDVEIWVLFLGGFMVYFKDLTAKILNSLSLYLCRGEFNHDGNENTFDQFVWLNPALGTYTDCYIIRYSIFGVRWGFFKDDKLYYKMSDWASWVSFKQNRFPMPVNVNGCDHSAIINLINAK